MTGRSRGRRFVASDVSLAKTIERIPGLIAYWDTQEPGTSEATALARDASGLNSALDGTNSNVITGQIATPQLGFAYSYDGTAYTDVYSAALNTAFDGSEGTAIAFAQIDGAEWVDGSSRNLLTLRADNNNLVQLNKAGANNRFNFNYNSGAGANNLTFSHTISDVSWVMYAITWKKSTDEVVCFANDAIVQSLSGLGVWAGNLDAVTTAIGARNTSADFPFIGYGDHVPIYNRALAPSEIASISNAGGTS